MAEAPGEISVLLAERRSGREDALTRVLPLVYNELRRLAAWHLRRDRPGHTLPSWLRRILVDHARRRYASKRGGSMVTFHEGSNGVKPGPEEILFVDQALERLGQVDPNQVRLIELHYFAGLSLQETAETMGISERSVAREWALAKAWLKAELSKKARL
jgi:DNA-directed RNA polymerase specialized sigma24 family protein